MVNKFVSGFLGSLMALYGCSSINNTVSTFNVDGALLERQEKQKVEEVKRQRIEELLNYCGNDTIIFESVDESVRIFKNRRDRYAFIKERKEVEEESLHNIDLKTIDAQAEAGNYLISYLLLKNRKEIEREKELYELDSETIRKYVGMKDDLIRCGEINENLPREELETVVEGLIDPPRLIRYRVQKYVEAINDILETESVMVRDYLLTGTARNHIKQIDATARNLKEELGVKKDSLNNVKLIFGDDYLSVEEQEVLLEQKKDSMEQKKENIDELIGRLEYKLEKRQEVDLTNNYRLYGEVFKSRSVEGKDMYVVVADFIDYANGGVAKQYEAHNAVLSTFVQYGVKTLEEHGKRPPRDINFLMETSPIIEHIDQQLYRVTAIFYKFGNEKQNEMILNSIEKTYDLEIQNGEQRLQRQNGFRLFHEKKD